MALDSSKVTDLLLYDECEVLIKKFHDLKTTRDVANLLNIRYENFIYYLYKLPLSKRYVEFSIPKKNSKITGEHRKISVPSSNLKIAQRKLSQILYCVYKVKPCVHGFAPSKSIVTNARAHKDKAWVLNIDLKDFFESINFGRVRGMFMAKPYELSPQVSTVLAQICCFNNKLPQGAPTSPIISNMICGKMDSQMIGMAKAFRCTYTRYADDITFSTRFKEFPPELAYVANLEDGEAEVVLGDKLVGLITENGFKLNHQKSRLQHSCSHQEVTGLTVNKFPNVDRKFVRQIRSMLNAWEKFGISAVDDKYKQKYSIKSRHPDKEGPSFKQVLRGKIEFLGMVRGKDNSIYQKHILHYWKLSRRDTSQ
jgi:RNA-directed DNA polymerase